MLNDTTIAPEAPLIAVVRCKNGNYSSFNLAGFVSGHESVLRDVSQREPAFETIEACVSDSENWQGPLVENAAETERLRRVVPGVDFAMFTARTGA